MTVWSLTQLLDAEATTTAKVGREHARKLPERTGDVNPRLRSKTSLFNRHHLDP
jgi:hypothetical protein